MKLRPFAWLRGKTRENTYLQNEQFKILFDRFQQILAGNNSVLETWAEMEDRLSGEYIFDINYLRNRVNQLSEAIYRIIYNLNKLTENRHPELFERYEQIGRASCRERV